MQSLIIIILIGVMGGVAIGVQSPLASMISQRLGVLESVFIVHLGGALVALVPLLIFGSKFNQWRSLPWYTLGAGAFGLVVIFAMSYMIPARWGGACLDHPAGGTIIDGLGHGSFRLAGRGSASDRTFARAGSFRCAGGCLADGEVKSV
jgi:uncharacterized membrane protein YdcZ (DUF606 family)